MWRSLHVIVVPDTLILCEIIAKNTLGNSLFRNFHYHTLLCSLNRQTQRDWLSMQVAWTTWKFLGKSSSNLIQGFLVKKGVRGWKSTPNWMTPMVRSPWTLPLTGHSILESPWAPVGCGMTRPSPSVWRPLCLCRLTKTVASKDILS